MPSYRYLKDIKPEDLQAPPEKPLEGKAKAKNWWHYHWKKVAIGAAALAIGLFFTLDVLLKTTPDMRIGLLTPFSMPDEVLQKMEAHLSPLVGDLNGDGKQVISIENYTLTAGQDEGDAYAQMAGTVKLMAAFDAGDPVVFIIDADYFEEYQDLYGLFGLPDGSEPPIGTPADAYTLSLAQWIEAQNPDLTFTFSDGEALDGRDFLSNFLIGVRAITDTKLAKQKGGPERWQAGWALIQAMEGP